MSEHDPSLREMGEPWPWGQQPQPGRGPGTLGPW